MEESLFTRLARNGKRVILTLASVIATLILLLGLQGLYQISGRPANGGEWLLVWALIILPTVILGLIARHLYKLREPS